jgi:hypothetical protein
LAKWKEAAGGLDAALAELAHKRLAGASQKYAVVSRAVEQLAPGTSGAVMGTSRARGATGGTPLPEGLPPEPPEPGETQYGTQRAPLADLRAINKLINRRDLYFMAAIWLTATVLGLNLLWLPDPSWGGWGDWLVALLWGLGLHQVGGAAFEGVTGLTDRFK